MSDPIDEARDWLAEHYDGGKAADLLARLVAYADMIDVDNYNLRRQVEGHVERIAAASEVIARNAERDALARLGEWLKVHRHRQFVPLWCDGSVWSVRLDGARGDPVRTVLVFGSDDPQYSGAPDNDPSTLWLGGGASLGACVLAALALWEKLAGGQKGRAS